MKSDPLWDCSRASARARSIAASGNSGSLGYLTVANSSPSGTLSVSTINQAVRVDASFVDPDRRLSVAVIRQPHI